MFGISSELINNAQKNMKDMGERLQNMEKYLKSIDESLKKLIVLQSPPAKE